MFYCSELVLGRKNTFSARNFIFPSRCRLVILYSGERKEMVCGRGAMQKKTRFIYTICS